MSPRTLSMILVDASPDIVRVECGRCEAQHVLSAPAYRERIDGALRAYRCSVCAQVGRLPDRRHHEAAVQVDRRASVQPPWVWPRQLHRGRFA